jgi:hypothetical protein
MRVVNPTTERFWVIDYRIFDPETDGLSKLDHVEEMLRSAEHRRMAFRTVLCSDGSCVSPRFLDVAGSWDPTLAFVMGGALLVAVPAYRLILGRRRPVLEGGFSIPTNTRLDKP